MLSTTHNERLGWFVVKHFFVRALHWLKGRGGKMPIPDLRRCALHGQCQAAWRGSACQRRVPLSCERGRREIAERRVRTARVVVLAPAPDLFPRLTQVAQAGEVEAFVAQLAVEAFDVTVLGRPSRRDVLKIDALAFAPRVEVAAAELGPVVAAQRTRARPGRKDAFQGQRDLPRADPGVDFGGQAFAGELIDDGQHPQRAPFHLLGRARSPALTADWAGSVAPAGRPDGLAAAPL